MSRALRILGGAALLLGAGTTQAQVRATVGHFAPFADTIEATAVNIAVNGTVALEGVTYGEFTGYLDLGSAGTYAVDIFPVGSDEAAISFEGELSDGDYTLLAGGDGANQPLQLIALVDDNSPPADGNIKLRVVHAAPFAATEAATAVSIRTDGGEVVGGLSEVPFPAASGYLEVPAGTYDLKVSSPDGSLNYIDPAPATLPGGIIATVVATGDGVNQPLGITALPVGELPLETPTDLTAAGLFYDPEIPGQGIQAQVYPRQDRLVGFVYTFAVDGTTQEWYHFDSCNSEPGAETCATPGAFTGTTGPVTVYRSTSGAFAAQSPAAVLESTGSGTISLVDCDTLVFDGDLGNGAGEVSLQYTRLGDRLACSAAFSD